MATDIQLRRGVPADAKAIAAVTRAAYAKWVPLIGREPLPMLVDYADALKTHRFDLLCEGLALVALIETRPQDDLLLVVNVAVSPDQQGCGCGRRLLALADDLALEQGFAGTRLYTNKRFEENIRLYLRNGYRIEREEVLDVGTRVHMVKRRL